MNRVRRRSIVLAAIGLFLLFDAGRSLNARLRLRPAPGGAGETAAAAMAWPPGADLPADAALGDRVYAEHCAVCHGMAGQGDGPAAPYMIPPPRDFTMGLYAYKTTSPGGVPSDEDLTRVVADGLTASATPYWRDILDTEEIAAVVDVIKGFSDAFVDPAPDPIAVPPRVVPDRGSISRGATLFVKLGCVGCHGPQERGDLTLRNAKGDTVRRRDLTAPWTFRGGADPSAIWLRMTTGLGPSGMPSYAVNATAEERWDIVNYIVSIARTPAWDPGGVLAGAGASPELRRRGEYLVHGTPCATCHSPFSPNLAFSGGESAFVAGGPALMLPRYGLFVGNNLTSDRDTGLGDWSPTEIADALRTGRAKDRTLNPWAMPWPVFHRFATDDALAVGEYLAALPPVVNKTPAPVRYGLAETIVGVVLGGVLDGDWSYTGRPAHITLIDGNHGSALPSVWRRGSTSGALVALQWLALAAIAIALLAPRARSQVSGGQAVHDLPWRRAIGVGLIAATIVGALLYGAPPWRSVPVADLSSGLVTDSPLDPSALGGPEQLAMAERGRYLYNVALCAYCHGSDGSGGRRFSAADAYGTVWSSNVTPDRDAGVGDWSRDEIARALRSGVSRDGRALHWAAMPWPLFSNLDEEDIRSLVVFLQNMPALPNVIPTPSAPSRNDCAEHTIFLDAAADGAGCGDS